MNNGRKYKRESRESEKEEKIKSKQRIHRALGYPNQVSTAQVHSRVNREGCRQCWAGKGLEGDG
jgi:hypothetical protein